MSAKHTVPCPADSLLVCELAGEDTGLSDDNGLNEVGSRSLSNFDGYC